MEIAKRLRSDRGSLGNLFSLGAGVCCVAMMGR